jgi:hypothetical protein
MIASLRIFKLQLSAEKGTIMNTLKHAWLPRFSFAQPVRLTSLVFALAAGALAQPATGLTVKADQSAFVRIDDQLKGIASPYSPVQVPLPPGRYRVVAEALAGGGRFEQEVEVEAGASVVVQAQLGPARSVPVTTLADDEARRRSEEQAEKQRERERLEQERARREHQARLLESQLEVLQRQKAEFETLKSNAERHLQDQCQNQGGNIPGWLAGIKLGGCVAAQSNRQRADTQIRRLQVEIDSKQREINRIDRQPLY